MEREASDIRSRSSGGGGGAGEPCSSSGASSSSEKHRCCICNKEFRTHKALCGHMRTHPRSWKGVKKPPQPHAEQQRQQQQQQQQGRDGRGSAAAEQSSIPVREFEEDVNPRRWESVVNQLLLLVEESRQWPQGGDDAAGSSENNNFITSDHSTARGGGGGGSGEVIMKDGFNEPANISIVAAGVEAGAGAGVAVDAIIAAPNGTVSDLKRKGICTSSSSTSSSSAAAGGSGAHRCGKCGKTFLTGQSLGGHMRKHYGGPPIIANKKRTREQPEQTPAPPTVERTVREPAVPTAHLESYDPALLSLSVQASGGGDCERNREEPEWSSAGNGACRLLDLDLNKPAEPEEEEEPKNAPQQEPERRDDDGDDDELLSLRLGQFDIGKSSGV